MAAKRFPETITDSLRDAKILAIRAGKTHRFIGIWVVVVGNRVFVRSWDARPHGWNSTFLKYPRGTIKVRSRHVPVRAVRVRSDRMKNAVSRAYAGKYRSPGSLQYVRGFRSPKRKNTTLELTPL